MTRVVCADCLEEGRDGCLKCGLLPERRDAPLLAALAKERWLPALAEALAIGDTVRYDRPPKVTPVYGKEPFVAPGTQGVVIDFSNGIARVQFEFRTANGTLQHSNPLAVIAGQRCEVNR